MLRGFRVFSMLIESSTSAERKVKISSARRESNQIRNFIWVSFLGLPAEASFNLQLTAIEWGWRQKVSKKGKSTFSPFPRSTAIWISICVQHFAGGLRPNQKESEWRVIGYSLELYLCAFCLQRAADRCRIDLRCTRVFLPSRPSCFITSANICFYLLSDRLLLFLRTCHSWFLLDGDVWKPSQMGEWRVGRGGGEISFFIETLCWRLTSSREVFPFSASRCFHFISSLWHQ